MKLYDTISGQIGINPRGDIIYAQTTNPKRIVKHRENTIEEITLEDNSKKITITYRNKITDYNRINQTYTLLTQEDTTEFYNTILHTLTNLN